MKMGFGVTFSKGACAKARLYYWRQLGVEMPKTVLSKLGLQGRSRTVIYIHAILHELSKAAAARPQCARPMHCSAEECLHGTFCFWTWECSHTLTVLIKKRLVKHEENTKSLSASQPGTYFSLFNSRLVSAGFLPGDAVAADFNIQFWTAALVQEPLWNLISKIQLQRKSKIAAERSTEDYVYLLQYFPSKWRK